MRKLFTLTLALMASFSLSWGQTLIEIDDMETTSGSGSSLTVSGWSKGDCTISQSSEARTGSYSLKTEYKGTNDKTVVTTNTSMSVANQSYLHCIGWAKLLDEDETTESSSTQAAGNAYVGGNGKGTYINLTTTWKQFKVAKQAGSNKTDCKVMLQRKHGAQKAVLFDDVVIYVSTNGTTDVTAPTAATSASITASAISWTCGSDANTGIQNTLIWHRTSGSADDLTLNNQGKYIVPAEGSTLDQSGHWTLVSASVAANATSYSGTFIEGDKYAIVHRDLAYNYSEPTYVTLASSCAATRPGEIEKGTASGGTGIITLTAGGNIADGDTWYWQTAEDGTATDLGSGATKNVNAAGTYYVRSYNTDGDCWSIARSITVSAEDLLTAISPSLTYASEVLAGNTLSPTLTGNDGSGAVSYALNDVTPAGSLTINTTTGVVTAVTVGGTATVTATIAANGNYKGNTATSGTITVVAPSHDITYTNLKGADNSANPTTYYEGTGVASFAKLRHVVGYDFTGWDPSSISTSATTDQTIEAQWTEKAATTGDASLTYALAFGSNSLTTSSITRVNGALYDATDLSLAHTSFAGTTSTSKGCSSKITTTNEKDNNNYIEVTFKVADGYTFTPTEVKVQGIAVSNDKTIEVELKDNQATPVSKSVSGTLTAVNDPTTGGYTVTLDFDETGTIELRGTVTAKIFAYGKNNHWRIGTPFVISGTIAAIDYTVTMAQTGGAGSTLSDDQNNKHYGEEITVTATAVDGFTFTGWEASPSVTFADADALSTTFDMPNSDVTITATFEAIEYTVTISKGENAYTAGAATVHVNDEALTLTSEHTGKGLLLGYYTAASAGTKVANADRTLVEGNVAGYVTAGKWSRTENTELFAVYDGTSTGIDDVENEVKAEKVLRNGQLFIEKAGKTYNAQGQLVK